jgi:hypothetical protein
MKFSSLDLLGLAFDFLWYLSTVLLMNNLLLACVGHKRTSGPQRAENGRWATRFLETLTSLWVGVVEHRWNSERPLVFQACILRSVRGISRFHNVKPIIWGRLDAWDAERYVALVRGMVQAWVGHFVSSITLP